MRTILSAFAWLSTLTTIYAASAEEWRSQSIYQVITDRFANDDPSVQCNDADQTYCGGTWNSILNHLDYIQSMGFTAIWISPVNKNYDGPRTPYGDPYHAYWVTDISKLNDKFGTAGDLKELSKALHDRKMLLMVDIVLNHHPTDFSSYFFKDSQQYHPYCAIYWGNELSEQQCWMGDDKVALMDVDTENDPVVKAYHDWIGRFVKEYGIDGLRIDAARHIRADFWQPFAEAAGVFCIGEVFENNPVMASKWQGPLDSILNVPLRKAILDAITLETTMKANWGLFKDTGLLGNFLENQDVPRWANLNAMSFIFMTDGIPIVYYGQEQGMHGNSDPYNREALWPSGYQNTTTVYLISKLNRLRQWMIKTDSQYLTQRTSILSTTATSIAIQKGYVTSVMTNIGSPPQNSSVPVYTPYRRNVATTDILSCKQYVVGSEGAIAVQYPAGGRPTILVPNTYLRGSGLCDINVAEANVVELQGSSATHLDASWLVLLVAGIAGWAVTQSL